MVRILDSDWLSGLEWCESSILIGSPIRPPPRRPRPPPRCACRAAAIVKTDNQRDFAASAAVAACVAPRPAQEVMTPKHRRLKSTLKRARTCHSCQASNRLRYPVTQVSSCRPGGMEGGRSHNLLFAAWHEVEVGEEDYQ